MGGDGIADREFVQVAGPGSEGTFMTFSPDARKNPKAKAIIEGLYTDYLPGVLPPTDEELLGPPAAE